MNDLISRKALLEDFKNTITEKSDTLDWLNLIANQPVAYDVGKVVNQLENEIFSAELYEHGWNGQTVDNLLCLGNVIEIVKGGGMDE